MNYLEEIHDARHKEAGDFLIEAKPLDSPGEPHVGRVVEVYYNTHRGRLSVRDAKTKKVFAHTAMVALEEVTFTVQPAGRERVRRTNRKNVHAWVRGRIIPNWKALGHDSWEDWLHSENSWKPRGPAITYNPYKYDSFVIRDTEKPICGAHCVIVYCASITLVLTDGKPLCPEVKQ